MILVLSYILIIMTIVTLIIGIVLHEKSIALYHQESYDESWHFASKANHILKESLVLSIASIVLLILEIL